ncbi:MAG: glycyl radical protein [Emergencia sp.]
MISERIVRLSEKVRDTPVTICLDRARLITEFYSEPSMEPFMIRRAKSFAYVLDNKKIFIDDDSILAGHLASMFHGAPLYPDMTAWLRDDLEELDTRKSDNLQFLPGEKDELREIVKKWEGRAFGDMTAALSDESIDTMVDIGVFTKGVSNKSTMNHAPFYDELVNRGYRYYIDQCRANIESIDHMDIDRMEQRYTWEAMIIVMEAIIRFAHRYADLAEEMAAECSSPERKAQLLTMAENCRTVPENPAQNFYQAAQLVWFTHLAIMMEYNSNDNCLGRFDQYMYPFYEKDLADGVSEAFIADIIHEFKLKIAELWEVRTTRESIAYPGCPLWIHMMIGGVLPDGSDGCNDLTRLILHCMEDLQTKEPCVSFRYHDGVDEETFKLALSVARKGGSHPAFFNDSTNISHLLSLGHTLEEARNWGICGCIEPSVPGITDFQSNAGYFNPSKVFEITLNNGIDPLTGKQIGLQTGDVREFTSVEQIMDAYAKQQDFFMDKFVTLFDRIVSCHAWTAPTITGSCFTHGCIEKGKVLQRKGADHRYSAVAITGIANIADSLAAIDECVFRKNYLTMSELMDLLASDFEGKENMRQLLINKAPKYGNDIEEVDAYAHWLTKLCNDQICKHTDGRDGKYTMVVSTQSYNVVLGQLIGALPDGRKAYTALADNASPMIGMDVNGPTAVMKSLGRTDPLIAQSGILVNQRFDPAVVKGDKGLEIIETVIRTYFDEEHGQHIQLNVVDDETLRAAQKEPQKYRNILVRVAGYSAYFVDLEKDIQDNIIARTLQQSL